LALPRVIRYTPEMPALSSAARRTLRSRAHHLRPYVTVGEAGLTPALIKEIDLCLSSYELIKVRVLVGDRHDRDDMINRICRTLNAHPVQHIGKILVVFRPLPEERAAAPVPGATRQKAKRPRRN
jgi:RNA-binding protein